MNQGPSRGNWGSGPRGGGGGRQDRQQNSSEPILAFDPKIEPKDLVDERAERAASQLRNTSTAQLRQFFQEVKDLQRQLQAFDEADRKKQYHAVIEPRFKMLRSRAAYAAGRNRNNETLRSFIDESVRNVKSLADFENFVMYFEAVLGFFYSVAGARS